MEIKECRPQDWDIFVENSPQKTLFNKSPFLESHGLPVAYLLCFRGEENIAGIALMPTDSKSDAGADVHFNGILFKDLSGLKNYRKNETVFEAMDTFANFLFNRYAQVEFDCHWNITDIRPFDWLNYHDRSKGYYCIDVRYLTLDESSIVPYFHIKKIGVL